VGLKARGGVSFLLSIKRRAATVSTLKNGSDAFSCARLLFLSAVLVLAGCDGSDVKKGDPDYPQSNPRPTAILKFHGSIDPGVEVRFASYWIATNYQKWPVADGNCNYMNNKIEGVTSKYTLLSPITLNISKDSFNFSVFKDEYLPGRCGWTFSGILVFSSKQNIADFSFEEKEPAIDAAELFVTYDPSSTSWPKDQVTIWNNNFVEILCSNSLLPVSTSLLKNMILKCIDYRTRKKIIVPINNENSFELKIHGSE